jgi:septal ring factor EnvC (AmiA/AmiB activator)
MAVPMSFMVRAAESEVIHNRARNSAIYCAHEIKLLRGSFFIMPASAVETSPVRSTADFKSLEEKVLRTIELLKSAREAKAAAERDAARLREQLNEREEEVDTLRKELVTFRREREEVRTRVEKMLGQIEALTSEGLE